MPVYGVCFQAKSYGLASGRGDIGRGHSSSIINFFLYEPVLNTDNVFCRTAYAWFGLHYDAGQGKPSDKRNTCDANRGTTHR